MEDLFSKILKQIILEDRCKDIAARKYDKPSAYRSGAIVRCRQGDIWKGVKEDVDNVDDVSKKAIEEIESGEVGQSLHKAVAKFNLALHSTNGGTWDKVDTSKIKGGIRAVYGWGIYFTPDRYKYEEYGGKDPKRLIGIRIKDLNFLDIKKPIDSNLVNKIESYSDNKQIPDLKYKINNYEKALASVKNSKEFKELSADIEDLNNKLRSLEDKKSDTKEFISNGLIKKYEDNKTLSLDDIMKQFLAKVNPSYEKEVSLFFKDLGYDGFVYSNQYVLFNFDKGIIYKDIKTLIEKSANTSVSEKSDFSKEKEQGLHGWFSRKGGEGKSKGWVDCNTCKKDPVTGKNKCKSCGRQAGEKRSKYPACRPTPSQCDTKGKGTNWGKKSGEDEK